MPREPSFPRCPAFSNFSNQRSSPLLRDHEASSCPRYIHLPASMIFMTFVKSRQLCSFIVPVLGRSAIAPPFHAYHTRCRHLGAEKKSGALPRFSILKAPVRARMEHEKKVRRVDITPRARTVVFRSILNKLPASQKTTLRCCVHAAGVGCVSAAPRKGGHAGRAAAVSSKPPYQASVAGRPPCHGGGFVETTLPIPGFCLPTSRSSGRWRELSGARRCQRSTRSAFAEHGYYSKLPRFAVK